MGWLFMTAIGMAPHTTPKDYLDAQCTYSPDPEKGRATGLKVLKSSVRSSAYYAACQVTRAGEADKVIAIICLVKWHPAAPDGYIFGYKDMDENMEPYYWDCPASILDLLTPTTNESALAWRAKCRQLIALTTRPKPKTGDTLVLPEPMRFSDGIHEQAFAIERSGTRIALRRRSDRRLVRISRLMHRPWSLVSQASH